MIRASAATSSIRTRSSTACASSMPVVPTITAGIPRAVNRRMSAPHGTPAVGASPPRSARTASRTRPTQGWEGSVSAGANAPPVQAISTGGCSPSASRTAASSAARAAAGSSPTRTPTRPSNTSRSGTELDHSPAWTRPTETGYGSASARIAGCATSALIRRSCAASAAWTAM